MPHAAPSYPNRIRAALYYMVSAAVVVTIAAAAPRPSSDSAAAARYSDARPGECIDPPEYYAIDLVPTKNLPGLGRAGGKGYVTYDESPFGISVTEKGHYEYDVTIDAEHLPDRDDGKYVAWVTTPDLDQIERIGPLDDNHEAAATVTFNKFLVVVTFEPLDAGSATAASFSAPSWQGPIILRGMSRSGLMHTMAGHGPYSSEPCAKYGY